MNMLTKSNYLNGLQCSKLLWVVKHDKDRLPEPSDSDKQKFSDGHIVGELAKKLYPNGIDLDLKNNNWGFMDNIQNTEKYLKSFEKTKERYPLFEPGFLVPFKESPDNQLFARGDILVPVLGINNEKYWDIIEVKMGTRVKDVNIDDVVITHNNSFSTINAMSKKIKKKSIIRIKDEELISSKEHKWFVYDNQLNEIYIEKSIKICKD